MKSDVNDDVEGGTGICVDEGHKPRPGSTLVVLVHPGRERALLRLLASVAKSNHDAMYPVEVVVVTQNVSDLAGLVQSVKPALKVPIRTSVFQDAETVPALRNRALEMVATQWMHSVDSDTQVPGNYFVELTRCMSARASSTDVFQLGFMPAPESSRWAGYEAMMDCWYTSWYISTAGVFGLNGMNFVARPDVLRVAGGFRETMVSAEDIELGYRLRAANVGIDYLPQVRIIHHYPENPNTITRRKFWHGQGFVSRRKSCPALNKFRPSASQIVFWLARRFVDPLFLWYYLVSTSAFILGMRSSRDHE